MVPSFSDERGIARLDYVAVIETDDEWDGLIGTVEDFFDDLGASCSPETKGAVVLVRIPTSKRSQAALRLEQVNFLTPYVRKELQSHDDLHLFLRKHLEWFDPNDL